MDLTLSAGTVFLCPQSLVLCAHCSVITFSGSTGPYSVVTEALPFQCLRSGRTGGAVGFCSMLGRRAGKHLPYPEALSSHPGTRASWTDGDPHPGTPQKTLNYLAPGKVSVGNSHPQKPAAYRCPPSPCLEQESPLPSPCSSVFIYLFNLWKPKGDGEEIGYQILPKGPRFPRCFEDLKPHLWSWQLSWRN